jgi:molybdopterin-guanine dinucleotide biosynthesis protein A
MSSGISVAILCGGPSRRFGAEKAHAMAGERPLVRWIVGSLGRLSDDLFCQLAPGATAPEGLPVHRDAIPGCGALSGLHGALSWARHDRVFVCASDMPGVDPRLPVHLARHEGLDAVVPRWANGWIEPMCALYGRSALEVAEGRLRAGKFRLAGFLDALPRLAYVDIEPLMDEGALDEGCFVNINSRDEMARWISGERFSPGERA